MANFIIAGILILIVIWAVRYIIKAKKSGAKCIGCPSGCHCAGGNSDHVECSCGCPSGMKQDD